MKLTSALRCSLCLQCRFKWGNPFHPAKQLLKWCTVKSGATNVLTVTVGNILDFHQGRLSAGQKLEVRCLRVDAQEWRYELMHGWPNGISIFVGEQRVFLKKPDAEHDEAPGPFDLTEWAVRRPMEVNPKPLQVSVAITAKKTEQWAVGIVLYETVADAQVCEKVVSQQAPLEDRIRLDLERVCAWVTEHRPDRVSKKDMLRCVEPPVLKLVCCTSLSRIEKAARGSECDHLQCFDLDSYVHTMRNIPPKHAWCCPVCDKPAPLHQLRLDAFAQSVVDGTENNVTEVLIADNGKYEVSATEDPLSDSDEEALAAANIPRPAPPKPPTQADLQQAALNLGKAFSAPSRPPPAPAPLPVPPVRERSRSPRRKGKVAEASPPPDEPMDKMHIWEKLQGIAKPEPKKEETRIGWLPDGAECGKCQKSVVEKGGIYCGRKRPNGDAGGCFAGICWKCMNKATKADIGGVRTTKAEFASLGPDAWWLHESCMTPQDKRAYFCEEEEEEDKVNMKTMNNNKKKGDDSDDDAGGKFAWE